MTARVGARAGVGSCVGVCLGLGVVSGFGIRVGCRVGVVRACQGLKGSRAQGLRVRRTDERGGHLPSGEHIVHEEDAVAGADELAQQVQRHVGLVCARSGVGVRTQCVRAQARASQAPHEAATSEVGGAVTHTGRPLVS